MKKTYMEPTLEVVSIARQTGVLLAGSIVGTTLSDDIAVGEDTNTNLAPGLDLPGLNLPGLTGVPF